MKLITFAIPCYNSAEYMEKCIDSLLKAGEEAEILIVNDGSTKDNTLEIAKRYEEKYPTICKAIDKPNGGHGDVVNVGLQHANGKYYKVIDSDDWVDESALKKVMDTIRFFENEQQTPDAIVVNYVYEHTYSNSQRVVEFRDKFPIEKLFDFEQTKKLGVGQFLAMHSVIYKTQLLKDINLQLPKHVFYDDNIFVYTPLPYVKNFYYLDVDFYRYFIGRPDQSVQDEVMKKRIDQHILINKVMIDAHDLAKFKTTRPKLYKYMRDDLLMLTAITSAYLIKIGDKGALEKKQDLWDHFMKKLPQECKHSKKTLLGITSSNNKFKRWLSRIICDIVRKKFKVN